MQDAWVNDQANQMVRWAVDMGLVDYHIDKGGEFIFSVVDGGEPVDTMREIPIAPLSTLRQVCAKLRQVLAQRLVPRWGGRGYQSRAVRPNPKAPS